MDVFLPRRVFPGPAIGVASYHGDYVGQALFTGGIAVFNRPRDEIQTLLPPSLELVANTSSTPDLHPVVFLFGNQESGTTFFGGVAFPLDIAYPETCLAVPFVKSRGRRYQHTFVAHMATSSEPAAWSGNRFYGFAKDVCTFEHDGSTLRALAADGAPRLSAALEPTSAWQPAGVVADPAFIDVRAMLALPVLGRKRESDAEVLIASYFDLSFADADIRSASAWLEFAPAVTPGLSGKRWHAVPSAAFEVRRVRWRVSWPYTPRP